MDDERHRSEDDVPETGQEGEPGGRQSPASPPQPGGGPFPMGPQAPAGPQSSVPPPPPGPQAPAVPPPGFPPPTHPQEQPPAGQAPGPEQPAGMPPPQQAPGYGGPVPPGGWQQPVAPQPPPTPLYAGHLASWGSRLGAHLIDGLVLLGVLIVAGILIAGLFAASTTAGIVGAVVFGLAALVVLFGYAPLLMAREGARNGQTLGKQVLNIRVVRADGQTIGGGFAALREIVLKNIAVGIASSIIPLIPWFLNYFWPLWDDENRALHDMAVNTRVVMTS